MPPIIPRLLLATLFCSSLSIAAEVDPLKLDFHRQSVRRFIFGQEILLGNLVPSEIAALDAMHPLLKTNGEVPCAYQINSGKLEINGGAKGGNSALYVSGINPYATYRLDVAQLPAGSELAVEFASLDRQNGVSVALSPSGANYLTLRVFKDGKIAKEQPLSTATDKPLEAPFTLYVQLYGVSAGVFATKDGQTLYLGALEAKDQFGDLIDFRQRSTMATSSFNIATKLPANGKIVLDGARSVLSSGIGQADIRMITYANGAPYFDNNRLWFTFSCRGLGTADAVQGVMSIDPSVFDPRFEGTIVFDRGDGLLRNDYASHVFYDEKAGEWRAFTACFSVDKKGRGETGLAVASSPHDPRRGFSVMTERPLTKNDIQLPLRHEDPSVIYDAAANKWRLLTCCFEKEGLRAELFESDKWNGPYTKIAGPVPYDSTGTQMQKFGDKYYVLSGASEVPNEKRGGILVYSYPELNYLGELKADLPSSLKGGRVWPNVFPLPPGFPARYMAIQMDRVNFPGAKVRNWSYGALYQFWADTPQIGTGQPYEFLQR
ncbi:MAG: hypothetical protein LBH01_10170 [Verrucomicrobiales bacterium]|jgi:hypothetical protein|nr:hypothetical protein [Verrucomicrobiales bacterium]